MQESNIELLNEAKELLASEDLTFIAISADKSVFKSKKRGVAPLLELLDAGESLRDYYAADKVVGKGAALLYAALQVSALYAGVISRPALEVLENNGIAAEYETLAEAIINRKGDGFCPIETAVKAIDDIDEAITVIKDTIIKMQNNNG